MTEIRKSPETTRSTVTLPSDDLYKLKSALRHNAQTTVHITRNFLRGKNSIPIGDGKAATLEVLTDEEIQNLLGDTPKRLRLSIATAKRPKYNGPLKRLGDEDLQRLEELANSDWSVPENIANLAVALKAEFQDCFKEKIVQEVNELAAIINGRHAIIIEGLWKSTNRATPEQITAYCEKNRREFIAWIQRHIDEEADKSSTRVVFLTNLLATVTSCDYTNLEVLDRIYDQID
ncbi:hypothetical protein ACFL3C_04330 [Patescibacteria group bacterium]